MSGPRRRRAVRLEAPGELRVIEEDVPPPGPGELLIRPDAVGICGTDLELLSGEMAYLQSGFAAYPIVPGHEWTGTVVELGEGVEGFGAGDRVVGECSVGCGGCARCRDGDYHLCPRRTETGIAGHGGAMATSLLFPAAAAHRVPDSLSAADAALVEPAAVAYRAVSRLGLESGSEVGVVGAGAIGVLSAMVARALGAGSVRVIEPDPDRRRFAAGLGFEVEVPGGRRSPAVIEASGSPGGIEAALDLCADGGSIALLGLTGGIPVEVDLDQVVVRDLRIQGSLGSPGVWPQVIALIADANLRLARLVTHEYGLEEAAVAFELAGRRRSGARKVIVRPNPS